MSDLDSKSWYKKYRPSTLDGYIFQNDDQKKLVEKIINDNLTGHALLSGVQGTGKTTLARIILNELNVQPSDVLSVNCSDETSIDMIRNKVVNFVSVIPDGDYRVVILEECDYLSKNAQASLRVITEELVDSAKFILTCNYGHKILPALKSRCIYQFDFKAPQKRGVAGKVVDMLLNEKIKFDSKLILPFINAHYPDFRKIINTIQQHSVNGELQEPNSVSGESDTKLKLIKLLETPNSWREMRELVCKEVSEDEYDDIYRFLYENLSNCEPFKNSIDKYESAIVLIKEYLESDAIVALRYVNMAALFIELGNLATSE